jgi:hypothetical protein
MYVCAAAHSGLPYSAPPTIIANIEKIRSYVLTGTMSPYLRHRLASRCAPTQSEVSASKSPEVHAKVPNVRTCLPRGPPRSVLRLVRVLPFARNALYAGRRTMPTMARCTQHDSMRSVGRCARHGFRRMMPCSRRTSHAGARDMVGVPNGRDSRDCPVKRDQVLLLLRNLRGPHVPCMHANTRTQLPTTSGTCTHAFARTHLHARTHARTRMHTHHTTSATEEGGSLRLMPLD